MRTFATLVLAALAVVSCTDLTQQQRDQAEFKHYCEKYNKEYKDNAEYYKRLSTYLTNKATIDAHNSRALDNRSITHYLGVNQYTDWSADEYQTWLKAQYIPSTSFNTNVDMTTLTAHNDIPAYGGDASTVDWRTKNVVGAVYDQGQCGSCWAFSSANAMGSLSAWSTGNYIELSQQQLVDCVAGGADTCQVGGEMKDAFTYGENGMMSAANYAYIDADGSATESCKFNSAEIVAKYGGYESVPSGDENALKQALYNRPTISVAMDASTLQSYAGGIFQDSQCSSTNLDHGVLLVGYGTENGQDYWLIKNSWGAAWGEGGYFRLARNAGNMCGVATDASYPFLH